MTPGPGYESRPLNVGVSCFSAEVRKLAVGAGPRADLVEHAGVDGASDLPEECGGLGLVGGGTGDVGALEHRLLEL